jgi:transposase
MVLTFCGGDRGIDYVMNKHLFKADAIITQLRDLKAATDLKDPAAKKAYEKQARQLTRSKLRHFLKAKNMIKEMHCRLARELTAKFDTIVLPPYKTKDMVQRKRQRPDGTIVRRVIRSGTVRRMLGLAFYAFSQLLGHRCLVDGSELPREGEEYTTQACNYCGRCYQMDGSKVFFCGLCCKPPFVAHRDEKAAFTLAVKCLALP